MKPNFEYFYSVFATSPLWVTLALVYVALGVILFLRDSRERVQFSVLLGEPILLTVVLVVAYDLLQRGAYPPEWMESEMAQTCISGVCVTAGLMWWAFTLPEQRAVVYHRIVVAPLLIYACVMLLPVIFFSDKYPDKMAEAVIAVAFWLVLVILDLKAGRFSQRNRGDETAPRIVSPRVD